MDETEFRNSVSENNKNYDQKSVRNSEKDEKPSPIYNDKNID